MNELHEPPEDLITGLLRQSYAGAVRQRLLAIERAVQSGQRHELIVRGLEQGGMTASMATFRKSLSRARIWWRKQLLLQLAQHQAEQQAREAGAVQGSALPMQPGVVTQASHSHPNAGQSAVATLRPALQKEVARDLQRKKEVSHPGSLARAGRVDLDQFFKPKSVFTKT